MTLTKPVTTASWQQEAVFYYLYYLPR